MRFVPMVNGRAWLFEHGAIEYQLVHLNGSDVVRLYARPAIAGYEWQFGHARETRGLGAKLTAERMHDFVTGKLTSAEYNAS